MISSKNPSHFRSKGTFLGLCFFFFNVLIKALGSKLSCYGSLLSLSQGYFGLLCFLLFEVLLVRKILGIIQILI